MKLHAGKDFRPVRVAATLVKSFAVYAYAREIAVEWGSTHGASEVRLFSAELRD